MIDTLNSKDSHYTTGSFRIGSGPIVILIEGSCRVVPYVNYFDYLNAENRFTIHLINVVNFYFDSHGNRTDTAKLCEGFENNPLTLGTIKATKWYLHEHTANFGMFNSDRACSKNIYQFGMTPEVDISIPNFNNIFILFQELISLDNEIKGLAKDDINRLGCLSGELQARMRNKGMDRIAHFLEYCAKTELPEMATLFESTWRDTRYFWTGSHISNNFTIAVMRLMNEKLLHLNIPGSFWDRVSKEDPYASTPTPITKYDVENYGLKWPQPVVELQVT